MKDLPRNTARSPVSPPARGAADGPGTAAPLRVGWPRLLAWLPIPMLVLTIAMLWAADLHAVYVSSVLLTVLTVVFSMLVFLFIACLVGRSFLVRGDPGLLLLGCGTLVWGVASVVAAVASRSDVNVTPTIFNTSGWLSALCHLTGVILSRRPWRVRRAAGLWLGGAYAVALGCVGWLAMLALAGWMPTFFVQGQGGTPLRHLVVGSTIAMFALTAVLLTTSGRRSLSPFAYWYAIGLGLIATAFFGAMIQSSVFSAMFWTSVGSHVLGSVYLLIATIASARESANWRISLPTHEEPWRENALLESLRQQTPLGWTLRCGLAVGAVAAGWGLRLALEAWVGPGLPAYVTFYPAVMAVALLAGFGPGLLATALVGLTAAYWVLSPVGQLAIASPVDRLGLVIFASMGLFMSVVAELYRRNRDKAAAYDRELALRETNRKKGFLANLLEHSNQPFVVGYPDGRLGLLNHAYEQLTGYTAAELRALDWSTALTPPEWRDLEKLNLDELHRTGQPVRYEKEYVRKDGSRVPIELFVHLMHDAQGKTEYFYCFLTDISERRCAEQAMRESEERRKVAEAVQAERERFNNVLDMLPAYVILLSPDYHVPFANRFFEERFGKSEGRRCFEYLFQRTEPCENCETYKVMKTGSPHRWEWTGPDGRNYDIYDFPFTDVDGSPLIMEVGLDITERKRAEAAVQAERQRFLDVLETLPVIVALFRPDHRLEWVNRAYREALGDNVGQLCYASQFGRDKPCEECQAFTPLTTGQPHNWEWALPNGRTFDIYNFPFADADGSPLILEMDIDITERRRAEAALKELNATLEQRVAHRTAALAESEDRVRLALTATNLGTWDYNPVTGVLVWDARCKEVFGLPPEVEVNYDTFLAGLHPEDRERANQVVERTFDLTNGGFFDSEYRTVGLRDGGALRWVRATGRASFNEAGQAVRFIGTVQDITARKLAEEALRESEEHYRLLFEAANDGVVLHALSTDRQRCRFARFNTVACRMLGYTPEEMSRLSPLDLQEEPDLAHVPTEAEQMRSGGRLLFEKTLVGKDGRHFPAEIHSTVFEHHGQTMVLSIIRDISERKRAEESLMASLAEKEVLLKEIHHRVKNNMQVISSLVALQADRLPDDAMRSVLQDVTHRVRSMALVHEKLYQSPDMARVEFAEYAQSLLNYLWRAHGTAASGVRLVTDLEPVPLSVNAAVPCGLILNELVSNALKHAFRGRAGGEVTVSLRGSPEGGVCLQVRDNGTGLPAGLDWRQADTLGLHLVQILAGQLRATVEVSSSEGTEFTVALQGSKT